MGKRFVDTWAVKPIVNLQIREERPQDIDAIRKVNEKAFGQPEEGMIVDKLREKCENLISLVAIEDDHVVGHILFSPVMLESEGKAIEGMGLAPMAVLPGHDGQGIGSQLARVGIEKIRETGCPFIIVLGHAEYYPRFGFEPASRHSIRSEWDVPDEVFMILVLDESAMQGVSGVAKYRPEFAEAM